MITPEIVSYIKAEKAKSTPDETIKTNLLNNGWKQEDINEALAALATNPSADGTTVPINQVTSIELKKHRNKRKWIAFGVLILIDFIIIMYMGGQGLFGISPLSIVLRIVVIYGIASFASIGSKQKKTTTMTIVDSVARVAAAVFLAIVIIIGAFFVLCLFALSNSHF